MEIKEVFLDSEKVLIKEFLNSFELKYDENVEKTFYLSDNDKIIGTISCDGYIIKMLAVDNNYQGENLAGTLINQAISYFNNNGIYAYQVFTKPIYKNTFISMGFRCLVETTKVVMLESGVSSIDEEIEKMKVKIKYQFGDICEESDIAAIVMNANPITNGHVYLIEEASKLHKLVLLFVVEEDKSLFSFKERLSLVYLATKRLGNVVVLASSKYMVSSLTFPDYFLKSETEKVEENAYVDALIFKEYFMKKLYIKKRYVGSETTNKMVVYNNSLKNILGDSLVLIDRLEADGEVISAKRVRGLLEEGKINEALEYIPRECYMVFYGIANEKFKR